MRYPSDMKAPSLIPVYSLERKWTKFSLPLWVLSDAANFLFRDLWLACLLFKCGFSGECLLPVTHYVSLISLSQRGKGDIEESLPSLPPNSRSPTPCSSSLRTVFLTTALGFAATLLGSKHFRRVCVTRVLHILFLNKVMWHSKDKHFSGNLIFVFLILGILNYIFNWFFFSLFSAIRKLV